MAKRIFYLIKKNLAIVSITILLSIFILIFAILNWTDIIVASVEAKTNMLTNVFVSFAAIWAVYEFIRKNRRARAEKSIELVKEFEKDIIPLINDMSGWFERLTFYKKMKELEMHDGLFFDKEELETIFTPDEIHEYLNFCQTLATGEILIKKIPETIKRAKTTDDNSQPTKQTENNEKEEEFIPVKIHPYQLLNKLEAFSMAFNHKVADESVVYPSLHQLFFSTVKTLYINIAIKNQYDKDKYFTNIIKLFNDWDKRYKKIEKKNKKMKEKVLNNFKEV